MNLIVNPIVSKCSAMKIILSHPTANNFTKALAEALYEKKLLYEFITSIATFEGQFFNRVGSFESFSVIRRRQFDSKLYPFTRTYPWYELGRHIALKVGLINLIRHESGPLSTDAIYRYLDRKVGNRIKNIKALNLGAVYAYEDGALSTFVQAKNRGIKCIYDLPIAYWETGRKLMREEAVRLPSWACTLGGGIMDSSQKLERKTEELNLADVVIVPSQFVRDSLPSWADKKHVVVAPFGTPLYKSYLTETKHQQHLQRPLRVLFAGSMGQRKGLGDLFDAIKLLNRPDIELVVMGSLQAPMNFYRKQLPNFIYESGRSNEQVLALMRTCDVFCLPSIVEGRALVMQEAMSQGLPLIITPNTGGEDLIIEGETGFLLPIRSPESIAQKLVWFLDNRHMIPEMGQSAQQYATQYTWKKYGETIIEAVIAITSSN